MAPFQASVPGGDAPGHRDETLWSSSRTSRAAVEARGTQRGAAEDAERTAEQRAQTERLAAEQRIEAERRAAAEERVAAERRQAERQVAELREAERRARLQEETERRAAQQRAAQERAVQERAARAARSGPVAPPVPPSGTWDEDDRSAPWATGPSNGRRELPPLGAPRVPARPAGATAGPAYGDWTRPSRSGESDTGRGAAVPDEEDYSSQRFARLRAGAPTETTDMPEPGRAPRHGPYDDDLQDDPGDEDLHDDLRDDVPARVGGPRTGPVAGPGTGPMTGTIGGRAALRAERQAAEAARRKSGRKSAPADPEKAPGRRSPRRAAMGLVAVAVVALGVLGVYSFASPDTKEVASSSSATSGAQGAATAAVPGVSDLPALSTAPAAPTTPAPVVHAPVTVLNATQINGLAASVAGVIKGGGWETTPVGAYTNKDVATSTVFFTQGDETQRQAAVSLVDQFPQLHGPAPRFFDVPNNAAPGVVVVVTGDWKP
jgi:LytR cell envelope-related transcriptional attenuator